MGDDVYKCFPAYPNPKASVYKPNIPLWKPICGALVIGKTIEIRGVMLKGSNVFYIDLANYRDEGTNTSDRPLHISIRPHSNVVVRNILSSGQWGMEEKDGVFPFEIGRQFFVFILVEKNGFRIAVDGKHRWEFAHRLDFSTVTMLHINGTVKIDEIRFREPYVDRVVPHYPQLYNMPGNLKPVINPVIPYVHSFDNGLTDGHMIYISGRPTAKASRLTFDFVCSCSPYSPPEDVAFHLDARMGISSLVRNTRINEKWGKEETLVPYFPFSRGVFFDIIIRIDCEAFMVAVDNEHFLEYRHRVFPISRVNLLRIEGDVVISSLRFAESFLS